MKKNVTVGIIGIKGAFGRWLEKFFSHQGCAIIGSDLHVLQLGTQLIRNAGPHISNERVVREADVVIFAVRLSQMLPVIKSLTPLSKRGQLWLSVGSTKSSIMDAMLLSRAESVTIHPLFAPPASLDCGKQTLVRATGRIKRWSPWLDSTLKKMGATVIEALPWEHDEMMLLEQNLQQAATLALAMTLAHSGKSPERLVQFSTASSRKVLGLIASLLANTPEVYADILTGNARSAVVLDMLIEALIVIRRLGATRRPDAIVSIIKDLRAFYGEKFIAAGKNGFAL